MYTLVLRKCLHMKFHYLMPENKLLHLGIFSGEWAAGMDYEVKYDFHIRRCSIVYVKI